MKTKVILFALLQGCAFIYTSSTQKSPLLLDQSLICYASFSVQEENVTLSSPTHSDRTHSPHQSPRYKSKSTCILEVPESSVNQHAQLSKSSPEHHYHSPKTEESRCERVCAYTGCVIVTAMVSGCIAIHLYNLTHPIPL